MELEAKAKEGELEGPVRHTCEDMELEEGDTELKEDELAEEGKLVGPAKDSSTELEAEAEEGELEEGDIAEERSWRPLSLTLCLRFLNHARC